jgi:hypothetical protein
MLSIDFWLKVNKHGVFPETLTTKKKWKLVLERYPEIAGTRCWEWTGILDENGYGKGSLLGIRRAHRSTYVEAFGKLPKKKPCVLHKCDNRKCCRPLHLFAGTKTSNNKDCKDKDRLSRGKKHSLAVKKNRPYQKGDKGSHVILSNANAQSIRIKYKQGNVTQKELGLLYGVTEQAIAHVIHRRTFVEV